MHRAAPMVLWPVLAILQLADIATTAISLNTRAAMESNRAAAALMTSYGQPLTYTIKAIGIGLVMLALYHYRARTWSKTILYAALVLTTFAVINNTGFLLSPHR